MKKLNSYIDEKLHLNKEFKSQTYNYHPKDWDELRSIIEDLLKERGIDADLNDIDISNITSFYKGNTGIFEDLDIYDIDISGWDVSNVTDMRNTFYSCRYFNGDLSGWNVSNVTHMGSMFVHCEKFTGKGLDKWNVKNVKNMGQMFYDCNSFNGKTIENWDVSSVTSMLGMFYDCFNITASTFSYSEKSALIFIILKDIIIFIVKLNLII